MTTRARFRTAFLLIPAVLLALLAATFTLPSHVSVHAPPAIDPADYGHVQAYDGYFLFTLAPNSDLHLRRYELGFGRVMFASAGMGISLDGKKFAPLQGGPMGQCGYHWQGGGVNALVAIGRCVPGWATVTGSTGHAAEWIRVENLLPKPVVVLLKYDPLP